MSASENALGALHTKLAEVLSSALDGQQMPDYEDPETGEVVKGAKLEPSAAIMTATIQFLKNNNITCAPGEDNAMGELTEKMRKRQERREARTKGANVVDFDAARESATFIGNRMTGS